MRFFGPVFGFATGLMMLAPSAWAQGSDACSSSRDFVPQVEVALEAIVYDVVQDPGSDGEMSSKGSRVNNLGPRWHVAGLTSAAISTSFSIRTQIITSRAGVCAYPALVRIVFSYPKDIKVSIQSKYPPGSCEYDAIYAHEMQHVEFMRQVPTEMLDSVQTFLADRISQTMPVVTGDAASAHTLVAETIRQAASEVVERMRANLEEMNRSIDTEENYRYVQSQCHHW